MGDETIEIIENDETIEIIENDETIEIIENSVRDVSFVEEGSKIYLDGLNGNSYIRIDPDTKRMQIVHNGIIRLEWDE